MWFDTEDLVGLSSTATHATVWAKGAETTPPDPPPLAATARFTISRVQAPTDSDHDGLQDACDACDDTPLGALIGADGCPLPAGPPGGCP